MPQGRICKFLQRTYILPITVAIAGSIIVPYVICNSEPRVYVARPPPSQIQTVEPPQKDEPKKKDTDYTSQND